MQQHKHFQKALQITRQHLEDHYRRVCDGNEVPLPQQPFQRNNCGQQFMKELQRLGSKRLICNIGLKIKQLFQDQMDLTIYLVNLLHHFSSLPIKLSILKHNQLWANCSILRKQAEETREDVENQKKMLRFLKAAKELIKEFLDENVVWSRISAEQYSDSDTIEKFKKEVIQKLPNLYSN